MTHTQQKYTVIINDVLDKCLGQEDLFENEKKFLTSLQAASENEQLHITHIRFIEKWSTWHHTNIDSYISGTLNVLMPLLRYHPETRIIKKVKFYATIWSVIIGTVIALVLQIVLPVFVSVVIGASIGWFIQLFLCYIPAALNTFKSNDNKIQN